MPSNWFKTANIIFGYTKENGEPYESCITGDNYFGYTLISIETLRKQVTQELLYADSELRKDPEIVLAAVRQGTCAGILRKNLNSKKLCM